MLHPKCGSLDFTETGCVGGFFALTLQICNVGFILSSGEAFYNVNSCFRDDLLKSSWGETVKNTSNFARSVCVCAAVFLAVLAVPAVEAQPQLSDWRAANDAVGKFLRGHIDIVRAEAKSGSGAAASERPAPQNPMSLAQAKQEALKARAAELFTVPGLSTPERRAQAVAVTELLLDVEQAWLAAVAANETLRLQENATEAALIAQELGKRMGMIGNWAADRVLAVQMDAKSEQLKLLAAQQSTTKAVLALEALVMRTGIELPERLPDIRGLGARADLRASGKELTLERLARLPDYASRLIARDRLQAAAGGDALAGWEQFASERIEAALQGGDLTQLSVDPTKVLWNHNVKEALHASIAIAELQTNVLQTMALAQATVINTHEQALLLANELVPLAMQAEEEAVYQYNGMFISTWNLLGQYRSRVNAQMAATNAKLLFLQTDAAFQAYLAGAEYRAPAGAARPALGANDAGGH